MESVKSRRVSLQAAAERAEKEMPGLRVTHDHSQDNKPARSRLGFCLMLYHPADAQGPTSFSTLWLAGVFLEEGSETVSHHITHSARQARERLLRTGPPPPGR